MERKLILFICLFFGGMLPVCSQEVIFDEANKLAQLNDFELALEKYNELLALGFSSAEVHHNIGNAYYHLENWPRAILHYEKAQKLNPHLKGTRQNLAMANAEVSLEIIPIPDFFLSRWWRVAVLYFPVNTWAWFQLLLLGFTVGGIASWLLSRVLKYKRLGFYVAVVSFGLFLVCFVAGISREKMILNSKEAIIVTDQASLFTSPDVNSPVVSPLAGGVKVFYLDELGDWQKVSLADREEGWIKKSWIEKI